MKQQHPHRSSPCNAIHTPPATIIIYSRRRRRPERWRAPASPLDTAVVHRCHQPTPITMPRLLCHEAKGAAGLPSSFDGLPEEKTETRFSNSLDRLSVSSLLAVECKSPAPGMQQLLHWATMVARRDRLAPHGLSRHLDADSTHLTMSICSPKLPSVGILPHTSSISTIPML
nr:hypothetical protein Iba_chr04bCG10420 [Ipomoea batatas]